MIGIQKTSIKPMQLLALGKSKELFREGDLIIEYNVAQQGTVCT